MPILKFNLQQAKADGLTDEQINQLIANKKAAGAEVQIIDGVGSPMSNIPTPNKPPTLGEQMIDFIPTAGGIIGGIGGGLAGTAVAPGAGTVVGGVGGAAAGQAAGEALRQYLTPEEDTNLRNIAKEGLMGGALEATGLGLAKGAGVALKAGGKGLGALAERAGIKALRLNPSQLSKIGMKGEEVTSLLKRFNLLGEAPEQIAARTSDLHGEYQQLISMARGSKVPAENISQRVNSTIKELLSSNTQEGRRLATELDEAYKLLPNNFKKGGADLLDMYQQKINFDKYTPRNEFGKKLEDTSATGILGNIFRREVNDATDRAGLKTITGRSLKELGRDIDKMETLTDFSIKQGYLGQGSLPVNIGGRGTTIGGISAGPVGAVAGTILEGVANSRPAIRAFTKATGKIAGGASKLGERAAEAMSGKSALLPPALIQAGKYAFSSPETNQLQKSGLDTQSLDRVGNGTYSDNYNTLDTQSQVLPNISSNIPPEVTAELERIATIKTASGQEQAIKLLKLRYPQWAAQAKSTGGGYSTGQEKELSDIKVAQSLLNDLDRQNTEMGVSGPIIGRIAGINPYSTIAQSYNARLKITKQIIGKALEGGVLRKEDETKYAYILPQISDTAEVAQYKSEQLKKLINQQLQIKTGIYGGGSVLPEVNVAQ